MNQHYRVLQLVLLFVGLLILVSLSGHIFAFSWKPLQRVDLVADLLKQPPPTPAVLPAARPPVKTVVLKNGRQADFSLFQQAHLITDFNTDTNQTALSGLISKLHTLKSGKKQKIRIAYLGDSMIEGDLISQTFRKLLQREFGGEGVGFVPIAYPSSKNRTTVRHSNSDNWKEANFKTAGSNHTVYLSGHTFWGNHSWINLTDQTIGDSTTAIEKSLLCGQWESPVNIVFADSVKSIRPGNPVNRIVLGNNTSHAIRLSTGDEPMPIYGVSFESASGVIVDNFSFRGVSGVEFAAIDSGFLHAIAVNNPYDLIILQYGINQLFNPNLKDYKWYHKIMTPSIKNLKRAFPLADFLLVSTADRAFRYGDEYKTAIGIDSLIKVQATLAYENNMGFYNLYQSMGGNGTIVAWANGDPSLANKDYVHPNHRGAEILGEDLFNALIHDYKKYKPGY
ncbi:MAG: hypothetical protein INR73_03320 [Williamsia sp.]|nr:hypothetical protein [Williamsia sp.]